jgi:flagellar biogenesis protein FliO
MPNKVQTTPKQESVGLFVFAGVSLVIAIVFIIVWVYIDRRKTRQQAQQKLVRSTSGTRA